MKKLYCILLSLIILVTTNTTVAFAADNSDVQFKTIRYTLANSEEKSGSMPVRIDQDHVYVDAEFIGALLGFTTAKNDKAILFENLEKTKRVVFYLDSTKVIALTFLNANLQYTSPYKTVSENSQIWIPLEFALSILDSSYTVVDDEILITPSQETIWSASYKVHLENEQYNFDWQDDFGYSEAVQKILGSTGYLTTLLNGILHLDGESALQFVTQFFGDSTVYDNKYGEDLAKLFVINSDEELEAMNDDIDRLADVFSPNGKFRALFNSIEEWEDSNAAELANKYMDLIKEGNASNLELNAAYKQFEEALDSEKSFLDSAAPFKKFQDTLAKDSHHALDVVDQIFDVIQYSSEYQNKDQFALDALKNYYNQGMEDDYIPEQIVKTFNSVIKDLESSIGEYTLKNFLTNDLMEKLVDSTVNETIKNKIGAKVSTALAVWNIVSEYVPCLKESLDGADKFILATYSQIFQSDSYRLLNFDSTTSKNELYQVAQAYYTYLKFCYVTRQSALATIEAQKYIDSDSYEKVKQYQLDINKEIADLLAVFKSARINADGTINNDNRIYGYLPNDNISDGKLLSLCNLDMKANQSENETNVISNSYFNDLYRDFLNRKEYLNYTKEWPVGAASYAIQDINQDGVPELFVQSEEQLDWYNTLLFTYNVSEEKIVFVNDIYHIHNLQYSEQYGAIAYSDFRPNQNVSVLGFYTVDADLKYLLKFSICKDTSVSPNWFKVENNQQTEISENEREVYVENLKDIEFITLSNTNDHVNITDMEITDSGQYTGNMGDSCMFSLSRDGLPGINNQYYNNGNIGLDGTKYQYGLEAWIARWNYQSESSWAYITYKLNKKYSELSCKTSLIKSYNTTDFNSTLYFYNGNKVLASYVLTPENYKYDFVVDVTDVDELKIMIKDNKAVSGGTSFALYDMFLN